MRFGIWFNLNQINTDFIGIGCIFILMLYILFILYKKMCAKIKYVNELKLTLNIINTKLIYGYIFTNLLQKNLYCKILIRTSIICEISYLLIMVFIIYVYIINKK